MSGSLLLVILVVEDSFCEKLVQRNYSIIFPSRAKFCERWKQNCILFMVVITWAIGPGFNRSGGKLIGVIKKYMQLYIANQVYKIN